MGEDSNHARAAPDLQIQPFQRIRRTDPHPMRLRIVQVTQHVVDARFEYLHRFAKRAANCRTSSAALVLALFSSRCTNTAFIASLTSAWLRFGTCTSTFR